MGIGVLLLRMGYTVGYRRVARLMKSANLSVSVKRIWRSGRSLGQPTVDVSRCDQVWVGDITYVQTKRTITLVGCLHAYVKSLASESAFDAILTLKPLEDA